MSKRNKNRNEHEVNLDPLMDVLTTTVGVMLFVVVFTIIEARNSSFKNITPVQANEAPQHKKRLLFICKDGYIKPLNMNLAYANLRINELTFDNMPEYIDLANQKNLHDDFFAYHYQLSENTNGDDTERWPVIKISEVGSGKKLNEKENISKYLSTINPKENWIAFAVCDDKSIEIYRLTRQIARELGIQHGWEPLKITFPLSLSLNVKEEENQKMFIPQ